jgi:hypothetical protein
VADVFDTIDATAPAPDAKGDVFDNLGPEDLPSREAFEASHHAAVKSFWERTKDAAGAVADIGSAAGSMVLKKAEQMTSAPLVSAGDVGAGVSGALGFGEKAGRDITGGQPNTIAGALGVPADKQVPGTPVMGMTAGGIPLTVPESIARGGAELVSGLTSPQNIGLGALMGPVAKIAPLLSRAVGAGFGVQMLKSVYDQSPEVQDAIAKKDWPRAAEAITKALGTGLLGVAAGVHAVRGGGVEAAPVEEQTPIQKATASARAGVEALTSEQPVDVFDQVAPGASAAPAGDVFDQVKQPIKTAAPPDVFDQVAPAAPRAPMSAQAAGTPDVFDQLGRTSASAKPLWEMSPNELDAAAAEAKGRDQADLQDLFGPDGAKQYTRLERAANSTTKSQQETAAASDQLEQMEAGLSQEQRNRLYGIGDDRPQLDDIRGYQQALGRVDTSSPAALGDSLKWAVTGIGDKDNPAEMTPDEQLRYAQLRHGMTAASAQGWDPVEVSQAAFRGAAGRVQSPEDAAFMLRRFAQPQGGTANLVDAEPPAPPREPATPPVIGRDTNVLVPGETTTYPARYAVRELADIEASHNAFSFEPNPNYEYQNDRDYSRTQNAARVVKNAAADTFNPDFPTTDSPTAEHGAPIIDASGNVLGGNSRAMTLARVYDRGGEDAQGYRDAIAAKAAQFGLDPDELDRFQKPVLVREVGGGMGLKPSDAQRAITDFNKAAAAELTPEERAVSDGRRLSDQTVHEIAGRIGDVGPDGTLADALRGEDGASLINHLVNDGVLTPQEQGGYLDDRGFLTPEAKSRIAKALVGRLFESPAEFRETTPAVRAKLERIAPQVLRVEGRPDWAITDQLRQALALSEDARVHKMPIDEAARQAVIGGDRGYTPEAIEMAKTLEQGPVKSAAAFRAYANDEALSRQGAQSAFFTAPTRAEAFRDAFGDGVTLNASRVPKLDGELRSEPYVSGAPTSFHAKRAVLQPLELTERERKFADAYVTNMSGMELVGRAAGRPGDDVGPSHVGLHIGRTDAPRLARNLRTILHGDFPIPKTALDLVQAVDRAAAAGKSVVLVADHPAWEKYHDAALTEELSHAVQASLTGSTARHLGGHLEQFFADPVAAKAARNLAGRYGMDPNMAAVETGVRLMRPDGYQELGLSLAEGRSLAAHYVRTLKENYGSQPARDISKQVFDAFRRGSEPGATESGAVPPGPGSEGRGGSEGGTGSDLSGYRPGDRGPRQYDRDEGQGSEGADRSLFGSEESERVARESAADRDKLQGERLTAQFDSPVSREEQLRRLRAGEQPPQTNLFEATPENQQFSLFGPEKSGERGGIDPNLLSLGAEKFVREDVVPAARRVASDLVEAKDDVMRVVAPQTRGSAAEYTALSLRQRMSQFSRRYDQAEQRLRDARQFFSTRTPEDNYSFIDNVERGLGRGAKPGDAELEPIARMFAKMLDQRRQEVQALGEGALKGYYTNYFPHIFERPEKAANFVDSFFSGKRNMEGPKSFLKHRDFPTFREALDAGLKPVSDNPVDLVMIKAREMDRYLLAHAALRDLAENGIAKRVSGLGPDARQREMLGGAPIRPEWGVEKTTDLPPNFKSIRDPVGGGKWYAQQGAADVLNNFLSPGLRTRSGLFRTMLGVNNTMNQANLGLSAFHLRAETISSIAGRMGLGFVKAMEGHPLDAAWHVFTSPAAPFLDYLKGSKMLHDWFKPGSEGAPIAAMVDAFMKGGGRAGQPSEYTNQIGEKMMAAFRRGNYIGGAIRSPFAAIEAMSKPLMQHLVPRLKMGAFADLAQYELEKLGPGAKVEDVRRAMAGAWDHVENRLGEMTHDNLFWNRTFKDIMQLVVRSVGWNLGSLKEASSAARVFKQLATGNRPPDLHGLGFVAGYTVTAAAMGAIMQYLHTGQGPQQLKDYFWPKREDGRRMVSAPYVKDAYQMGRDPAGTLVHKTGPLVNTLAEMVTNKDYYDRPIRNLDDPVVKQLEQEAEFVGRQFLPFTLQPYFGNSTKHPKPMPGGNTPEHKAENFLGITPAPAPLQPGYKPRHPAAR